ncbi:hypothetical protein [Haloarcula laminariae]|uniref:hypothetical protein n=1 Tax=Haloarcula laminariae TaxID=2961577 RepID=UPI0024054DDF|nr:hypothetical protein [Halomicroarcula sp. FL173]
MSGRSHLNRRRFIAIGGSAVVTGLAGCSGGEGNSTSADADSPTPPGEESADTDGETTPTDADSGPEKPTATTEPASGYLIDSLSDYRTVTENPNEWVGKQIAANDVKYYEPYQEEYEGFRVFYDDASGSRPFMLKNAQPRGDVDEFRDGERISFEGTVEKIGEIQGVKIILVENVTLS